MSRNSFLCAIIPSLILAMPCAHGQQLPIVDVTLAENGAGQVEVRLRPNGPFNGLVSTVTFTLRWQEQFGPAVSVIEPVYPQSEYLPLASTSIANGDNGYLYRTYNAISLSPMSDFGRAWEGGVEYPICTLDVLVPGTQVELLNDDFTADNNRNYYVSLNGQSRTGAIYPGAGTTVHASAVNNGDGFMDVLLTPEGDYFGWVNEIDFTLRWPTAGGSLGVIQQDEPVQTALPVAKVGPEVIHDGFTYQRFHGEGTMSLAVAQAPWTSNEDHLVLHLPIIGSMSDATVANDDWTDANDGEYRMLLNGHPGAGGTDEVATDVAPSFHEVIPVLQVVGDELRVTTSPNGSGPLMLTVLNAAGQPVAHRRAKWGTVEIISMNGMASGMYVLHASTNAGPTARRFLY